jgi:glycosyltransferase involved in cell wall biosynthesis
MQSYPNVEAVVVDDGSADATASIASSYANERIRVLRQNQSGPSAARNAGIAAAQGEYIAFLDDDDLLMPRYLEACMGSLSSGKRFVTSNSCIMYRGGLGKQALHTRSRPVPPASEQRATILRRNFVSIMSVAPRSLFEEVGGFEESFQRIEDWDLWTRAILAGWRVNHQATPLAILNRCFVSQSSAHDKIVEAERQLVRQLLARPDLSGGERSYLTLRLESPTLETLTRMADAGVSSGDWRAARENYSRARRLAPDLPSLLLKHSALKLLGPAGAWALRKSRSQLVNSSLVPDPQARDKNFDSKKSLS